MNAHFKREERAYNRLGKCRTRKCSKYIKNRKNIEKSFEKIKKSRCSRKKSSKVSINCYSKVYKGSNLEKFNNEEVECSSKKCSSQEKILAALR